MLREISARTGMGVVFLEGSDCVDGLMTGSGFSATNLWTCTLVSTGATVPIARFTTLWNGDQWALPPDERPLYTTTSFLESDTAMLLHVKKAASYGWWRVFAPFHPNLWFGVIGTVVLMSLVMPAVLRDEEHRPLAPRGALSGPRVWAEMLYHSSAELFGGGDLEWTHGLAARLLRVGWLFFVLITISSYTANLAAFFTAEAFETLGPKDMTMLRGATACHPNHGNDEAMLARYASKWGAGETMGGVVMANMPSEFANKTDAEKRLYWDMSVDEMIDKCAQRVLNEEAEGIMEGRDVLTSWLLNASHPDRCANWTFSSGVSIPYTNPVQIFLSVHRSCGFPFFRNVQNALAWLRQDAPVSHMARIYQRELRRGEACPERGGPATDTTRISLESQLGVFVITLACAGLALVVAAYEARKGRRMQEAASAGPAETKLADAQPIPGTPMGSARGSAPGSALPALTDGDMLRRIVADMAQIKGALNAGAARGTPRAGAPGPMEA